ncbi:MAG: hypothetical protein ACJAUG_003021 [Halioglobus sp.]|jgi:hypothetical protein
MAPQKDRGKALFPSKISAALLFHLRNNTQFE